MFDIHGGGIDLVFPTTRTRSRTRCCAFGSERMANYWMHNGFLQVERAQLPQFREHLQRFDRLPPELEAQMTALEERLAG